MKRAFTRAPRIKDDKQELYGTGCAKGQDCHETQKALELVATYAPQTLYDVV
jgi:hypothetical protein